MRRSSPALFALLLVIAPGAFAQAVFDLGTGGTPTITGSLNGTVFVSASPLVLTATVNFGELSPVNRNAMVRVSIPVTIRSEAEYQVVAAVTASNFGTAPDAVRLSDIGVGIINLRQLGRGRNCRNPHTVYAPFNNDPALTVQQTPRAAYPADLSRLTSPVRVISGPQLSTGRLTLDPRNINNGWSFDLVLAVQPQFFLPGTSSATVQLTISRGPALSCN